MPTTDLLMLWSDQTALSVFIWLFIIIVLMYLARHPAHATILAITRALRNGLRITSRSVLLTEQRLKQRNREVLLAAGREATERYIEREFQRVETLVTRDLSSYPTLHRELMEQITRIDEDYRQSAEVPPSPPTWLKAVDAVAKIPTNGDPMVAKILGDIHGTLKNAHNTAMQEFRSASSERHMLLRKMMPSWRRVSHTLEHVEKKVTSLEERSNIIDRQVDKYEEILLQTDHAARLLSSSSMTQFVISGVVLLIAIMGGFINFQLIALPMSEMVGGNSYLGPIKTADVAALVIICVEVAMGLFLMESLHITQLFPVIGSMDDKMRKHMAWITFSILFVLASIESSLAYMRDLLAADKEALTQALSGIHATVPEFRWIPSMGQMIMGFILPFALTFVAIPLESFIHSSRTVIGVILVGLLRTLAFVLRLIGNFAYHIGNFIINIYDLIVFIPLRIELGFKHRTLHSTQVKSIEKHNVKSLVHTVSSTVETTDGTHP